MFAEREEQERGYYYTGSAIVFHFIGNKETSNRLLRIPMNFQFRNSRNLAVAEKSYLLDGNNRYGKFGRSAKFGAATVAVPFQLWPVSRRRARSHDYVLSNETVMEKLVGEQMQACARVQQGDRTASLPRVCRSRRKSSTSRPANRGATREITFSIFLSPRPSPLHRFSLARRLRYEIGRRY